MIEVGAPLPDALLALPVQRADAEACALGDVLAPPAVLVVLRHFGCAGCDLMLQQLSCK